MRKFLFDTGIHKEIEVKICSQTENKFKDDKNDNKSFYFLSGSWTGQYKG